MDETTPAPAGGELPGTQAATHAADSTGSTADTAVDATADAAPNAAADARAGTGGDGTDDADITYGSLYTVQAASRSGGLHRGNLAVLIRYWTVGEGRAKIGWGTGGDFMRCVRRLSKYVPPNQVKGFCARLHKKATGTWPGPGRGH